MKQKYYHFILLVFFSITKLYAQPLSTRDNNILRYEAGAFVLEFELLLNNLSNNGSAKFERDLIIENSFTSTGNQIFLNKDVIIEDDINPNNFNYKKVKDLYVEKYLRNFDIFYKKQAQKTIRFSDIYVSEVKQGDYIYLEVFFQSNFSGSHLTYRETYQQTSRVATIIANREGRLWKLRIASIVFYNPKKHSKLFNLKNTKEELIQDNKTPQRIIEENNFKRKVQAANKIEKPLQVWNLATGVFMTYESNVGRPGVGASIQLNKNQSRLISELELRYIFRERYNISDTTFTINRIALGGTLQYALSKEDNNFIPFLALGFNYLSSTLRRNDTTDERAGANALGAVIGGGVRYNRKENDKLFYKSKITYITGKAQRIYLEVGVGIKLNQLIN